MSTTAKSPQAAIVAALNELGHVAKDGQGNYGRHATIGSVLDTVKPILAAHGLAVVQSFDESEPGFITVRTRLLHADGMELDGGGLRMPAPNDPQKVGGAISYARRYALMTFLGLAAEDDDGQGAADAIAEENAPHPLSDRVAEVVADMKRLTDTKKEELKAWADGRSLAGGRMLADERWLEHVEAWLAENEDLTGGRRSACSKRNTTHSSHSEADP